MQRAACVAFLVNVLVVMTTAECSSFDTDEAGACDSASGIGSNKAESSLLQVASSQKAHREVISEHAPKAPRTLRLSLNDVLLYNHLGKAGGSFIRGIISAVGVIPEANLRIEEEAESFDDEDRSMTFTVGSVRNPCEYYVSCWAFGSKAKYDMGGAEQYYGTSENLDTPEDKQLFDQWLRYVMPTGHSPGLLTTRLLWSYANESVASAARPEPTLQGWTEQDRLTYLDAANVFEPSSVDCWIHTENITDDLRRCLTLFEERAGGEVVNWSAFNATVKERLKDHEQLTMEKWTKNSGHQSCDFYYTDQYDNNLNSDRGESSKKFVLHTDEFIFTKFNYPKCCA